MNAVLRSSNLQSAESLGFFHRVNLDANQMFDRLCFQYRLHYACGSLRDHDLRPRIRKRNFRVRINSLKSRQIRALRSGIVGLEVPAKASSSLNLIALTEGALAAIRNCTGVQMNRVLRVSSFRFLFVAGCVSSHTSANTRSGVTTATGQVVLWSLPNVQHVYGFPGTTSKQKGALTVTTDGLTFTGKSSSSIVPRREIIAVNTEKRGLNYGT